MGFVVRLMLLFVERLVVGFKMKEVGLALFSDFYSLPLE